MIRRILRRAGTCLPARPGRNLFWACRVERNFGDWLGPFLFTRLTGLRPVYCHPTQLGLREVLLTVGSVLHHVQKPGRARVWGSGIIFRDSTFAAPRRIHAVRGPRTRARCLELGYDCPEHYGDPAILLPLVYDRPQPTRHAIGLIPHMVDADLGLGRLRAAFPGAPVIEVRAEVTSVIDQIRRCERVVASSLHGIIVAHAYGIPARRLILTDRPKGDGVKFDDYYEGVGLRQPPPLTLRDDGTLAGEVHEAGPLPDLPARQTALLRRFPGRVRPALLW